jgi:hypothetical protein
VPRELGALVGRDVDLVFVFSDDEPGLDRLARHGGRTWRRLLRRGLVRLERVPGADHTLTPVAAQRHVESVLTERLLARHGCDG